jgi:hypothetical protein
MLSAKWARKKEDTGFMGSVSSGGEKMRRTRLAFYVTYLIVSQLSDPSTDTFRLFLSQAHSHCLSGFLNRRVGLRNSTKF